MLKKILFAIASVLVGLLLVYSTSGTSFYNEVIKQCVNAVEEGNYIHAEKFVSYALDDKNKFYNNDFEDGTHIEIYSSLIISGKPITDSEGNVVKTANILEECIQISIFNLPETFAVADKAVAEGEEPIKGGATLVLNDGSTVFIPFNNGELNLYDYITYYSFLPVFLSYEDYQANVGSKEISSIKITDGNGVETYTITPTKTLSFNNNFHNDYYQLISNYNNLYLAYDETAEDAEEQVEAINNAKIAIDEVDDGTKYSHQHSTNIIYKSSGYIWTIVIAVVIFVLIDGVLGFLLFKKKKTPSYGARKPLTYNGSYQQPTRAPEQFSRKDVFDAQEGTFVIEDKTEESEKAE